MADSKTQAAVMMCIIVIGEAAARIWAASPDFVTQHPEFRWHEMRGLRNRGAHDYYTIRFSVVWAALNGSLPELLDAIDALGRLDPTDKP